MRNDMPVRPRERQYQRYSADYRSSSPRENVNGPAPKSPQRTHPTATPLLRNPPDLVSQTRTLSNLPPIIPPPQHLLMRLTEPHRLRNPLCQRLLPHMVSSPDGKVRKQQPKQDGARACRERIGKCGGVFLKDLGRIGGAVELAEGMDEG